VHVKAAEARLMTGEEDLERAAMALRKAGARNVVITTSSPAWSAASSPKVEAVVDAQAVVGAQAKVDAPAEGPLVGAMLRGKIRADVPALPARVISRIGARDALMATLLARLQITGFYEPAIAAALKEAMVISAQACERWGACD
jgi:sugar/nucleoside kinase (ribokinase family)